MEGRILICKESALKHKEWLRQLPWQLQVCTGQDLLRAVEGKISYDLIIFYHEMKPANGLQMLGQIRRSGVLSEVIIVSKSVNIHDAVAAIKAGAFNYLTDDDTGALQRSIVEIMGKKKACSNILAQRMDMFVKENANNALIDLNMLADHFRLSISYISRLFSQEIGVPFRKRVRFYRVQMAKKMLEQSKKPLYAIAKLSGFSNQKRLSETFVQFEGIPPLRYRQLYRDLHH